MYAPEMNGYIKFYGCGAKTTKFTFVGLTSDKLYITTFGIRNIKDIARQTTLIVI